MPAAVSRGFLASVCVSLAACAARAVPPAESLLPISTKAYVAAPNFAALVEHWNATPFAGLFDDESMRPFFEDLGRQIDAKWPKAKVPLEFSFDDFRRWAVAEVAMALVPDAEGNAALALLVDVSGNEPKARKAIDKLTRKLIERGGSRQKHAVSGLTLEVVRNPAPKGMKTPITTVYALHGDLLFATNDLPLAEELARRNAALESEKPSEALCDSPAFQTVMERCRSEANGLAPDLRWFIEPLGLAASLKSPLKPRRRHASDLVRILRNQGFVAVEGIGGFLNFNVEPYPLLHRTFAFAPPPRELALRMLVLDNGDDLSPPEWTPSHLTGYTSLRCDLLAAVEHADTLFDEYNATPGLFQDTLTSIQNDTGIDLRRDLLAHLGMRITVVKQDTPPTTPTSRRRLVAFEVKDEQALAKTLKKSFDGDPQARLRKVGDYDVWELEPEAENASAGDRRVQRPLSSLIALAHGQMFISTDLALLQSALAPPDDARPLADDADCRIALAECARLGGKRPCVLGFSRGDEGRRMPYELFRQGKLRESDSLLGILLSLLSDDRKKPPRQAFDGGKLPEFETVSGYFGPSGGFAVSESDGWLVVGFDLAGPATAAGKRVAARPTAAPAE